MSSIHFREMRFMGSVEFSKTVYAGNVQMYLIVNVGQKAERSYHKLDVHFTLCKFCVLLQQNRHGKTDFMYQNALNVSFKGGYPISVQ